MAVTCATLVLDYRGRIRILLTIDQFGDPTLDCCCLISNYVVVGILVATNIVLIRVD